MQHGRGAPSVAEIFERQECLANVLGGSIIPAGAGLEQFAAKARGEHARAGGEAGQIEIAQMYDSGPLANAADDAGGGHTTQQAGQVGVILRILADNRVLDGFADFGVDQAADGVETGFAIGAEIGFVLDVDRERNATCFGDFAQAGFQAAGIARIGAWQHEDGGKTVLADQRGLVHGTAVRRADAGNDGHLMREATGPLDELGILGHRDVVEKRIAAVDHVGDPVLLQMAQDFFVLDEIERTAGITLARERRDGKYGRPVAGTGGSGHPDAADGGLLEKFFARHECEWTPGVSSSLRPSGKRYNDGLSPLDLIKPDIRNRVEELGRVFQSAQPFRHIVLEDFLAPEFCRELMAEFPAFDREKARNELGEEGRKAVNTNLPQLGPAYSRLDGLLRDRAFLEFMGRITGIPHLLYDPKYLGGGTHENLHGQDLDPHVDFNYHPLTQLHRRLNLILFLNPEWCEEWGGALELHVNPWLPEEEDRVKSVVPLFNRAVVFETSEISWHGFKRIELPPEKRHLSRRSIAVYYYTRRRPADETAPEHSTVYVPRQLPEQIRTGYSLKQADVDMLRTLMARRDMLIRFLYEREKEFSPSVRVMLGSKSYKLYKMLIQPVRAPWTWWKTRNMR